MGPNWYYVKDDSGRAYFVVFAEANGSCSKRRFDAQNGSFVDQTKGQRGKGFAEVFAGEMSEGHRIGELQGRPNLEAAVRKGRLPDDVWSELRRNIPR